MSIISPINKTISYSKPSPTNPTDEWFVPKRVKCHICTTFGRKPMYKNLFQLYYHFSYHHSKPKTEFGIETKDVTETEEWHERIEQLLAEVRK